MCDLAYALCVERITAEIHAVRQAVLIAQVFGAKADLPSVHVQVAAFDEALIAEPKRLDPAMVELREALGLRGHGG